MKTVMLLGPSLNAVSGVSTHLNQLLKSHLVDEFNLIHFQVGSQGRNETHVRKLLRIAFSPLQLLWRLIQHRPQIVHVNTTMDAKGYWRDLVYMVIARSLGTKIIYQIHGGALPQDFFRDSQVLTHLLQWVLRSSDMVVVLGRESLTAYQAFAPGLNVAAIPNAITPGDDPHWKRTQKGGDRPLSLVYVGRLAESKGVFEIIESLAILHLDNRPMSLIVAGNGPAEEGMRARVMAHGLQQHVRFVGVVHGAEKERLWNESDLFVFPTYHEGLPYALLESMAARTPPLISPVGEIPDVVEDGVHGFFVPCRDPQALANAICRLDSDRDLIHRMGESGRQRIVSHYTSDRLAVDFRRTYLQVLHLEAEQVTAHDRRGIMRRKGTRVLGALIDTLSWDEVTAKIVAWGAANESRYVCACNVHSVVTTTKDPEFKVAVNGADMSTPDGAPIAWACRHLGYPRQERINGPDLMWRYLREAERLGQSVYFYGSTDHSLGKLRTSLAASFPALTVVGMKSPKFRTLSVAEDEADIQAINASGANVLFVGLGCPKQEKWMAAHRGRVQAVMIGVGAAFDFHSGVTHRAPVWMQRIGLEWLHRLLSEPRRLFMRYLTTNTRFVIGIANQMASTIFAPKEK